MEKKYPKIAFGTWSWGVGSAGGDEIFGNHLGVKELRPVFDAAMKHGFNLWDSAVVYGMGASESILGTFTKEYPLCARDNGFTPFVSMQNHYNRKRAIFSSYIFPTRATPNG